MTKSFKSQVIDKILLPQRFINVFIDESKEFTEPFEFTRIVSTYVKRESFDDLNDLVSLNQLVDSIKTLAKEHNYLCFIDCYMKDETYRVTVSNSSKAEYRFNFSKTVNDSCPIFICNITSIIKK